MKNTNYYYFFQVFIVAALSYVIYSPFLVYNYHIDGEIVYTAGFSIILYVIWLEIFVKPNDILTSSFSYLFVASFWSRYKFIESSLMSLLAVKINLLYTILLLFSLTSLISKSLVFIKFNNISYRASLQVLNKLKAKNKALPLQ
jgi:hypothetical protein